jgi:cytochrome c oxidase accessory protein FixG
MAFVTIAMMLDFVYFREQVCIIMCPYGRFQSVLLDQSSLIVSYDQERGEPRGRVQKGASALPVVGDCVDCGRCVTTCPTGIDIRKGLQMECINCTQCIDACNDVMAKLGRAPDLIRYSSQARDQGRSSRLARPRLFIYPTILLGIATLFLTILWNKQPFNAYLLRERGNPFTVIGDNRDQVRNVIRLKITNRTDAPMTFELSAIEPPQTTVTAKEEALEVPGQAELIFHLDVVTPLREFGPNGQRELQLRVTNQAGVSSEEWFSLQGPERRNVPAANTESASSKGEIPASQSTAESTESATAAAH